MATVAEVVPLVMMRLPEALKPVETLIGAMEVVVVKVSC